LEGEREGNSFTVMVRFACRATTKIHDQIQNSK